MITTIIMSVFVTGVMVMSFDLWFPYGIIKKSLGRSAYVDKFKKRVSNNIKLNLLPFS